VETEDYATYTGHKRYFIMNSFHIYTGA